MKQEQSKHEPSKTNTINLITKQKDKKQNQCRQACFIHSKIAGFLLFQKNKQSADNGKNNNNFPVALVFYPFYYCYTQPKAKQQYG